MRKYASRPKPMCLGHQINVFYYYRVSGVRSITLMGSHLLPEWLFCARKGIRPRAAIREYYIICYKPAGDVHPPPTPGEYLIISIKLSASLCLVGWVVVVICGSLAIVYPHAQYLHLNPLYGGTRIMCTYIYIGMCVCVCV